MDDDKYQRTVAMQCPTCGGTEFETDEDLDDQTSLVRCISCNHDLTKARLIEENRENLEQHRLEMADEVVDDLTKEMKKELKKAFRGDKNIKIK